MLPNPNVSIWRVKRILDQAERSWSQVTFLPRWSDTPYGLLGLFDEVLYSTLTGPEPHDAIANHVLRCPTCWDTASQRPTNPSCPTCYGVGWNGGYNHAVGLRMFMSEGSVDIQDNRTQEQITVPMIKAMHVPRFLLLPQDIVQVNASGIRYEVGRRVEQAGLEPPMVARMVNLLPLSPHHVARTVPIIPVAS